MVSNNDLSENYNILNILDTLKMSEQSEYLDHKTVSSLILSNKIPYIVLNNDVENEPFLFRFIQHDKIFYNLINKLLLQKENINNYVNIANQNLLFKSLESESVSDNIFDLVVELTRSNYLDINQYDNNGMQAHHYCLSLSYRNNCQDFNLDQKRFIKLISNGLNLSTPDKNGIRCIQLASQYGLFEEGKLFIDFILRNTYREIYEVDNQDNNCLHQAAHNLNQQMFEQLCNRMSNKLFIFKRNKNGLTPFDIAKNSLKFYEYDLNNSFSSWNELFNKYQIYSENYQTSSNKSILSFDNVNNKLYDIKYTSPCQSISAKNLNKPRISEQKEHEENIPGQLTPNKKNQINLNKERRTCRLSNASKQSNGKSNNDKYSVLNEDDYLELITEPIAFNIQI